MGNKTETEDLALSVTHIVIFNCSLAMSIVFIKPGRRT